MKPRDGLKNKRGTTLVEVLVAMTLMLFVFLFLTADLIQSSGAENLASNHTSTVSAANYLIGIMRSDGGFWTDWATGPTSQDACGNNWTPYTDDITKSPVPWHAMCTNLFPEMAGSGVHLQYMWNAKVQSGDPQLAELTVWVMTDEASRHDIYELKTTRMKDAPYNPNKGVVPSPTPTPTPTITSPPPSKSPSPTPTPTPKPSTSPTAKPSPTPTPSPSPTGIYE